jgi:hypothetical protein
LLNPGTRPVCKMKRKSIHETTRGLVNMFWCAPAPGIRIVSNAADCMLTTALFRKDACADGGCLLLTAHVEHPAHTISSPALAGLSSQSSRKFHPLSWRLRLEEKGCSFCCAAGCLCVPWRGSGSFILTRAEVWCLEHARGQGMGERDAPYHGEAEPLLYGSRSMAFTFLHDPHLDPQGRSRDSWPEDAACVAWL